MQRTLGDGRLCDVSRNIKVDDVLQLNTNSRAMIKSLEDITGGRNEVGDGMGKKNSSGGNGATNLECTESQLRRLGRRWAWHVLELPIAWIMGFCYIVGKCV